MKIRDHQTILCPFCNTQQKMVMDTTTSSIHIICDVEGKIYKICSSDKFILMNIRVNLLDLSEDRNLWFLDNFEEVANDNELFKESENMEKFLSSIGFKNTIDINVRLEDVIGK